MAEYIKESEAYLDQQEIRKLAVDLDNFSYEYDTYEYKDTVENREEQVEKLTEDILNKETAGLKDWLTEVCFITVHWQHFIFGIMLRFIS